MAKNKEKQLAAKKSGLEKERQYLYILSRSYVIFVLAIYPLIIGMQGYDNIIFSKAQVYWWVTGVFLFVFSLFYLAYRLGAKKTENDIKWYKKFNIIDWALIAFFVVVTISSILSPYQDLTWRGSQNRSDGWLTMFCMLACYFPISRWYKPKRLDFMLYAISSAIFCIIGYLQFYGYDFMHLFPYNRPPYADEAGVSFYSGFSISFRSTIGNIDFVSAYVCMAVLAFGVLYVRTKSAWRFAYLAVSVMNYLMLIIAGADAGKVGVLGAVVLLLPYVLYEKKSTGRTFILAGCFGLTYVLHHWHMTVYVMPSWGTDAPMHDLLMRDHYSTLPLKPILAAALLSLAIGVAILLVKQWLKSKQAKWIGVFAAIFIMVSGMAGIEVIGRSVPPGSMIYQAREVMHGNMEDSFGSNRGYIWRNAVISVPRNPLFGTGQDTFFYALSEETQNEARERYGVVFDKAHNDFLQILLCNGVFGLIAYLLLIFSLIAHSVIPAFDNSILLMAFAVVFAYLVQSLFGIDSITVTPLFWLMIAITRNQQTPEADMINKAGNV